MRSRDEMRPEAILIAGPTASGKSAFALTLAEAVDGVVVNADSMQVYRDLRILTARPSMDEENRAAHRLYGHVDGADAYSAARWLADVSAVLADARRVGKLPVIVGGTGLYFRVLTEGLSEIPPIPDDVRTYWRSQADALPPERLHAALAERDAEMAGRLAPRDRQRVVRALEVFDGTGRSLSHWQQMPARPLLSLNQAHALVLDIDREVLQARCDARLDMMIEAGAMDEIARLADRGLDTSLPVMRAIGVSPLLSAHRGEVSAADALEQAKLETRQYVKRQQTWLKRYMMSWNLVNQQQMENIPPDLIHSLNLRR